uniref:Uncharacterized protein n=1 Tax=Setaria viridis TaxID=4556 RepID=A0A4U6T4W5_SETVI|nr:hypothetical protein SEVIR_9G380750v2 [Setaria viridis]
MRPPRGPRVRGDRRLQWLALEVSGGYGLRRPARPRSGSDGSGGLRVRAYERRASPAAGDLVMQNGRSQGRRQGEFRSSGWSAMWATAAVPTPRFVTDAVSRS